jgi:DNA-binding winged helix-turn-helix (wHTH) protein
MAIDSESVTSFGVFEIDRRSGELRKGGVRVRLAAQPFEVLLALLDRAGQVVTRDELQRRIWPADTFVDFDRGLNKAVNRLRDALGDTADSPRFIETIPKRGYRFIAPVQQRDAGSAASGARMDGGGRRLAPRCRGCRIPVAYWKIPADPQTREDRAGGLPE